MSNFTSGLGSLSGASRSAMLSVPSLRRISTALAPATSMVSTTICFDSNGITATEMRAESRARNSLSLLCSDSDSLPTLTPRLGQNASSSGPSIFRPRCFFSCTTLASSVLMKLASNLAMTKATPAAMMTSSTAMAMPAILSAFIWIFPVRKRKVKD